MYCGEVPEVEVAAPTFTDSDATHVLEREAEVRNRRTEVPVAMPIPWQF